MRWCIEQGEARVVFAQENVWGPIMDKLFAKNEKGKGREGEEQVARSEYNAIAWVNDMGRDRYGSASMRLLGEAMGASDLGVKHVRVWGCCVFRYFSPRGGANCSFLDVLVYALTRKTFPTRKLARGWNVGRGNARWCGLTYLKTFFLYLTTSVVAFHDGLDFIAVQEKLLADFRSVVSSIRGKQKNSVEAVLSSKADKLKESERKGLIMVRVWM